MTDWQIEQSPIAYDRAVAVMEEKAAAIRQRGENGLVWLLEHPALYTAGTSALPTDLLGDPPFPVHQTGRGGQYTCHGPGQRIAYVMLDLHKRDTDLRKYIYDLEDWIITALKTFDVHGKRSDGRVGVWVDDAAAGAPKKISAIGVRVRKWVTYHGVSINRDPDLSHYRGIVPCGIRAAGVTSLKELGVTVSQADLDAALRAAWTRVFEA